VRDITLGETFYHFFTTRAFATGVPGTLSGTPVLSVLEENNVTPITAGVSVQVDRASVVGLNQATIVATSGNGYEAGKSYALYISTGTVGGTSVIGEVVGEFTVQASAAFTRLGAPAGASVSADVASIKTDTGTTIPGRLPAALVGGRMDSSVGAMAANVLTATAINADAITDAKVAADVTIASVTGAVGSVTGAVGSVTGAVGSVTAAVAITSNIKRNQALAAFMFLMTDSTNHNPATGLAVTVTRSIDGAAFAAGALSAVTEVAAGMYRVDFAAGDLDGKVIVLRAVAAASDDTFERIVTVP